MNKILSLIILALVLFGVWYYATNKREMVIPEPIVEEEEEIATTMPIKLYYYNPSLDQGEGGVQCTEKGLVAVDRIIPITSAPLSAAIELLLKGEISGSENGRGIESEFPLEGLTLKSAVVENGVATLTFEDPMNKTGGGSCRVGVLWAQIAATAKQFPTVTEVKFLPEELFQP